MCVCVCVCVRDCECVFERLSTRQFVYSCLYVLARMCVTMLVLNLDYQAITSFFTFFLQFLHLGFVEEEVSFTSGQAGSSSHLTENDAAIYAFVNTPGSCHASPDKFH